MRVCPHCKYNNYEGVLFCDDCGQSLAGIPSTATKALEIAVDSSDGKNTWGTSRFDENYAIVMHFRDSGLDPVVIMPHEEITMGRHDATSTTVPTLDLTPYGAYERGVSRMHALVRRGDGLLNLIDLGSVNGTYLNGQRLIPNQPRVLRDGDEIKFSKLVCYVYFKPLQTPKPGATITPPTSTTASSGGPASTLPKRPDLPLSSAKPEYKP